jgi:predicted metal-dependent HD superfamily phosphohydrolase
VTAGPAAALPLGQLPQAFLTAARDAGAGGDVAGVGSRLLGRWAEPHRGYHDLRHLAEVLARVDQLAAYALDLPTVRLAAWFHDAIYDPAAPDNEERAAAYAESTLPRIDVAPLLIAQVARLVRLTATHQPADGDADGAVLCDADLAVLASPPERYRSYVEGVRREHAHVDDAAFATGRAAVLRTLLGRPWLFATEHGHTHWEEQARANVSAELRELTGTADPRPAAG